ncbi:hypothetical protein Tco_1573926, partial [Tanacetum coccineum]
LFYLDSTWSLAPNIEKLKHAIKFWKNEMLKNAEKEELDVGGRNEVDSIDSDDGDASQTSNEDEIANNDRHGAQPDNGDQFNPYGTQYLIDTYGAKMINRQE